MSIVFQRRHPSQQKKEKKEKRGHRWKKAKGEEEKEARLGPSSHCKKRKVCIENPTRLTSPSCRVRRREAVKSQPKASIGGPQLKRGNGAMCSIRPRAPSYNPHTNATDVNEALRQALAAVDGGMVCAYLFGSRARGEARAASDVDVAVLFEETPPATLDGLRYDLSSMLEARLRRFVDLVVLNHAPVDLIHRVLRDGAVIIERDRSARIRFEVKARNEFFDLAPVRARYRSGKHGHAV